MDHFEKHDTVYKKLEIGFEITPELDRLLTDYVDYLNTGKGLPEDYHRTEIQLELNFCYREHLLKDDQIQLLRDYYQHNGIKKEKQNG